MERRQAARTRRSQTDSLDLLVRGTLYSMLTFEVLLVAQMFVGGSVGLLGVGALLGALHAGACFVVLRKGLGAMLRGEDIDRWAVVAMWVVGAVVVAVVTLSVGAPGDRGALGLVTLLVASFSLFALAPLARTRTLTAGSLAVSAVVIVLVLTGSGVGERFPGPTVAFTIIWPLFLVVVAGRMTCWMLSLVWQIDAARTAQAQLAVAEERLRFSRDLHDVVGRTLSVVAVKSELAAELARRGLDGAADQMLEVRQIAQDSLREVRSLATGYRSADLDAELAGARSLLRSAGIDARTTLAAEPSGSAEREVLAWVVREATTNVVRHSDARWCTLEITREGADGAVVLTITNDGVERSEGVVAGVAGGAAATGDDGRARRLVGGTGLVGLRERCAAVGGTLETSASGTRFTVVATVPDGSDRQAEPARPLEAVSDQPDQPAGLDEPAPDEPAPDLDDGATTRA